MNYSDDLKSNFRSWEIDHDNREDAESLFETLKSRHPDEKKATLYKAALDWVGYNPEAENEQENNNAQKYNKSVTAREASIIDVINEFFDGTRLASSTVVFIADKLLIASKEWMVREETAKKFLLNTQELLNPDPDEYGDEIEDVRIDYLVKLVMKSYELGASHGFDDAVGMRFKNPFKKTTIVE